ncbi:hypothetical protein C3H91_02955 [Campylobacter jejuni]|nr:hypothetical protein C3H91_02955 [Campylobacter jejuni]RTJ52579.1 hypothetical protein C3H69_01910 [Campylobacter jejuni]
MIKLISPPSISNSHTLKSILLILSILITFKNFILDLENYIFASFCEQFNFTPMYGVVHSLPLKNTLLTTHSFSDSENILTKDKSEPVGIEIGLSQTHPVFKVILMKL